MGWHIFGVIIGIIIYSIYRYNHEECDDENNASESEKHYERSDNEQNNNEPITMEEETKTRELALNLLKRLGAEPKEAEDGHIQFEYQGILFLMEAVDECLFVNLIWPWCHSFPKFDIDEFARAKQVMNEINMRGSVSVFYTISDSDEVAVHIKKNFVLVEHPDLEWYMRVILDGFFRTARTLDIEIEKAKLQECSR